MSSSEGRSGERRPSSGASNPRGAGAGNPRRSAGGSSGRGPGGRNTGGRDGSDRGGDRRQSGGGSRDRDQRGSGDGRRRPDDGERRGRITVSPGGDLPRWVRDEITRSTPKPRREAALHELQLGLGSYSVERFKQAASALRKAKDLAPRAATIRELLGLSLYQLELWEESLRELRTYRRLAGDTTHLAVEMDCLRALKRPGDVDKAWGLFEELGSERDAEDEIRVVYASHLLDQGRIAQAWRVIKPGRLVANAPEAALRRWAVAARTAVAAGDRETAQTLVNAIRKQMPAGGWLEDLESELAL